MRFSGIAGGRDESGPTANGGFAAAGGGDVVVVGDTTGSEPTFVDSETIVLDDVEPISS